MSLLGATVMTSFMSIQNPSQPGFDNPEKEALRHLGKALYIEYNLKVPLRSIEKRYVPKWVSKYSPYVIAISKVVTEKRVSYTWTF